MKKKRKARSGRPNETVDVQEIWLLRALVSPWQKGGDEVVDPLDDGSLDVSDVKLIAGLARVEPDDVLENSSEDRRWLLSFQLEQLEAATPGREGLLFENVQSVGRWFGLSEVERDLLHVSVNIHTDPRWRRIGEILGGLTNRKTIELLTSVLGHTESDVARALSPRGVLATAGLVTLDSSSEYRLIAKIDLLEGLADKMFEEGLTAEDLLTAFARPIGGAECDLSEFGHLGRDADLLRDLIKAAVTQRVLGVNILLYGWTGTGKTALARALAESLGLALYEVGSEGDNGNGLSGRERMGAYRLSQQLLARREDCLVLFDEVEDIFPQRVHPLFGIERRSGEEKARTNHLLESNPVPAIWVSNEIDQIDPAFRRRFDLAIELPTPPPKVRASMLRRHASDLAVREQWIEEIARDPSLTPGRIGQAARVTALISGKDDAPGAEAVFEQVLRTNARALGIAPKRPRRTASGVLDAYSPAWTCTDASLERLVEGVAAAPAGARICLYGPPGTGKSAFARYLAETLDRPLHEKRASDILGPYVGQTEANLAAAFESARRQEAVLLLDEIDGLLHSRDAARASWEVTQVNELLQQIEACEEGIVLATTNRLEALDPAVLRRFDAKVRFDALDASRAWLLYKEACRALGLNAPRKPAKAELQTRLARLTTLTPGDFSSAVRKLQLFGRKGGNAELVEALEEECRLKPGGGRRPIGFLA